MKNNDGKDLLFCQMATPRSNVIGSSRLFVIVVVAHDLET
jgi:hypothetical protein